MKNTKEIEEQYKITRQTLHTWIKEGLISQPKKDAQSHIVWTREIEEEISTIVKKRNSTVKLNINNRRYLGSKYKLLKFIETVVDENTEDISTVADVFSGTGVVADLFRRKNKKVIVNDLLYSNYVSAIAWFGNDPVNETKINEYINTLNNLEGINGYITQNFGDKYFSIDNAMKIDSSREFIENIDDINDREKAILLTSLLYASDKVANTVGHYDAFRKKMDSTSPLLLREPKINHNTNNEVYNMDANQLVRQLRSDLVYIDTPYNSRGYESAYHVLENLITWQKPTVEGISKKATNRSEKRSAYTGKNAPLAFRDLILNIDSRYILVSYNNMAKKGNSRSNAKISNQEIIDILRMRGDVTTYSLDHTPFSSGKSSIENHQELLYLCKVNPDMNTLTKFTKSALNYTGGKYKLLPQIIPHFPLEADRVIDLFSGGASIAVNLSKTTLNYKKCLINDKQKEVVHFYRYLKGITNKYFISKVESAIKHYNFSNTKINGYEYYNTTSNTGLSSYNKEQYIQLRNDYNSGNFSMFNEHVLFYLLIVFGFNNQIRFNSSGQFNLPSGKRDFNISMEHKLTAFQNSLKNDEFDFMTKDFRKIKVRPNDFIYVDPPYLLSTASYNENNGWNSQDDIDLFSYLDNADKIGAKFALSNVTIHKGSQNTNLIEWSKKYNLHVLDYNYNNSNYQSNADKSETVEVLITNY